jgi:hypothetical protein
VPVDVCGTSVADVSDVVDVVLTAELEVVDDDVVDVTGAEGEVVDEEFVDEGLLEQAASARAQAGRMSSVSTTCAAPWAFAECTAAAYT